MSIRCPKCNSTNVYTRKDGTRRCARCGHESKGNEFEAK